MPSILEAYGPDRMGRPYGWRPPAGAPNPYTMTGYHRGQDVRKTNPTGAYSVVTDLVSLSAGVVSHVFQARSTGREIVVDTGRKRGRYEIHCHGAALMRVGKKVASGARLGRSARADENPGTAWSAPHDHFVISDYPDAGHVNRPTYDPLPFITAALAAAPDAAAKPAGGGAKPIIIQSEEDDMRVIYLRAKGDASVYALDTATGKRRGVPGPEWKAIEAAYKAAGQPVPYAKETITVAELAKIPNG